MKKTYFSFLLSLISLVSFSQCNPYAGANQETCDQTTQLFADTTGMNITSLTWSANIAGVTITPNNIPNPMVSIASMVPAIYGDSGQVTVWFYINTTCPTGNGMDSVSVIFYQVPTAYAGVDDSNCVFEYDLQGQFDLVNNHSQGHWDYVASQSPTGAVVNFLNDTVPTSTVQVSTSGTYTFVWSEWNTENNNCIDRDTVVILFLPYPNIDAGPDFSVCGQWAELNTITAGNPGQWNSIGGVDYASYNSIDSINADYQDSAHCWVYHATPNDTITFYWTEYDWYCAVVDSVNVYFAGNDPAIVLTPDTDICGSVFTDLSAQPAQYGYGYWIDSTNNTTFLDTPYTPHPDSVVVSYYGMHHFNWIVNNGACVDTSNPVNINFLNTATLQGHFTNMIDPIYVYNYYGNQNNNNYDSILVNSTDFNMNLLTNNDNYLEFSYANFHNDYPDMYYNNTFSWTNASPITATCLDTVQIDITMQSIPVNMSGSGILQGSVYWAGSSAPYPNAGILLVDSNSNDTINYALTDVNGQYQFSGVPDGHYFISVDIFSYQQISTHYITVTPTNQTFYNLDFEVDSAISTKSIAGIYAVNGSNGIEENNLQSVQIFPNPSSGILFINSPNTSITSIEISDITGNKIWQTNEHKDQYKIHLTHQAKGVYFVKIQSLKTTKVEKLIIH